MGPQIDTGVTFAQEIRRGIPDFLPEPPVDDPAVSRAPARPQVLSPQERELAVRNALRYFPAHLHSALAPEFARELAVDGRIYMRRYRPHYPMRARPIAEYGARSTQAAAILHMLQNNLDPRVAQHPYELITYGGNGTVFQNWAQYLLTVRYLAEMTEEQTLVLYSGHPLGLFPSHPEAPRVVVTNGIVIPNHSSRADYDRMAALGVTSYGQMTAGSFMYIGPQGIVHGTTITLLNAGRMYLGREREDGLAGAVFVTSGLGGMSGAQGKAARIAGAVGVIAEVNPSALRKRLDQGWIDEAETDLGKLISRLERARRDGRSLAIGYLGNVVDLWEELVRAGVRVELGSDQTSLHNPFAGGYYPAGLTFEEANRLMVADPAAFRAEVEASLRRQVAAIHEMSARGMFFWDYGNAFLLEASRAGAPGVVRPDGRFAWPSYVEDIMGPTCFDYGFGPFRWVCLSGDPEDLRKTDRAAMECIDPDRRSQDYDNWVWIRDAEKNALVVGTQARILYQDAEGRTRIALKFNEMVRKGEIGPVMLGRDHHDVSGTDSPYRETANIKDGSNICADMATVCFAGNAARGMTLCALHNGGGVGIGKAINGGFGLLLDGRESTDGIIRSAMMWDVLGGVARRAWARNPNAMEVSREVNRKYPGGYHITLPYSVGDDAVKSAVDALFNGKEGN